MGNITAKLVKDLRDKTGAGMMDCKKALNETDGNVDKALEWLRKKGIASAEKKSGRVAAEGSIGSYIHTGSRVGVLLELNCETDFVARGDIFQSLLRDISMQVAACPNVEYVSIDEIPEEVVEKALEWLRKKGIASAEKKSGRVAAEGSIGSYIHTGSRVGVLIELNCETDFVARGDIFQSLLKDVSMQVAACPNVEYVSIDEIPEDVVEKEKQIEMGRDDLSGKPEQIKEKIVQGRIAKRLNELVLLSQPYIKDSSLTVEDLVKQAAAKIGENIKVRRFTRYTLGEGIEKNQMDFAEEVASMQSN